MYGKTKCDLFFYQVHQQIMRKNVFIFWFLVEYQTDKLINLGFFVPHKSVIG